MRLLLYFTLNILAVAGASNSTTITYIGGCMLDKVVNVQWDEDSNRFIKLENDNDNANETPSRRNLRGGETTEFEWTSTSTSGGKSDTFTHDETSPAMPFAFTTQGQRSLGTKTFQAQQCSCAHEKYARSPAYCITSNTTKVNTCGIPQNESDSIICYLSTPSDTFVRNAWPISLVWLAAIFVYAFITEGGRMGIKYACRCCCKNLNSFNEDLVDEILRREAEARRSFQRIAMRRYEQVRRERGPITYILKTKEYVSEKKDASLHSPSSMSGNTAPISPSDSRLDTSPSDSDAYEDSSDNHDNTENDCDVFCRPCYDDCGDSENDDFAEDAVVCTICIMEIEEGDRIGALPCNHMFHVDCLKEWIKRKNTCPLCQSPDIAKEKESESTNNTRGNSDDSENNGSDEGEREAVRTTGAQVDPRDVTHGRQRRNRRITRNNGRTTRQLFHVNGDRRGRVLVRIPASQNPGTVPRLSSTTTTIQVTRRTQIRDLQEQRRARMNALRENFSSSR